MKEHHFRTWDSATRKMTNYSLGPLNYTFVPHHKHPVVTTVQVRTPDWVSTSTKEYLIWTRRVDRNGRKIFEGDIISTPYGPTPVLWSWKDGYWKTRFAEAPMLGMIPTESIELEGNFGENRELLE
jgi:hypothetical protein